MKDQDPEDREQNIWDPDQEDQVDREQKDQEQDNWEQEDQMQVYLYKDFSVKK